MDRSEALSVLRDYFALNTTVRGTSSRDEKCIAALNVLTPPPAEQASGERHIAFLRRFKQEFMGPHEQDALDAAIAALSQRPVEAYLIERLSGEGYGRDRQIVDAKQYNAMSAQFWVNDEARQRHRVTPLAPQQPEKGEG